jgi:hypothetical protein
VLGIVREVDHLDHLTVVLANDIVRRNIRPASFEPSDGALVPALAIVQDYEVNMRAATTREIGRGSPEKWRKKLCHRQISFAPYAVVACKKSSGLEAEPPMKLEAAASPVA